jgi:hypothetical protein
MRRGPVRADAPRLAARAAYAAVAAVAAVAAACSDPAIEMHLELPPADVASGFDVSCIGAVEVYVRGSDRGRPGTSEADPGQPPDDLDECITIEPVHSFSELRSAIAGRFELALPASGLAGVDVRGSTGTCKKDVAPGDSIFYGAAKYEGGDSLAIPMTPNLSCGGKRPETVRPVDMLALTRTIQCPANLPDGAGTVYSGTIHPVALESSIFDSNDDLGSLVGNVASLPLYVTASNASCVALAYGGNTGAMTTASCVRRGIGVCTVPGQNQIELPFIDGNVAYQAATVASIDQYGGWVIGGVWGVETTTTRVRLAGATVRPANAADADKLKVVYADYPAGAASPRELAGATATNATGLFIVYVGRPVDVIVSAPGYADETVRIGSPNEPSTALIVLSKR